MSRESDEKRELLKLKQGLIEESELIEEDVHEQPEKPKGFKWFENFMYRNKWYAIAAVFLIVITSIMVHQLVTKESADMTVLVVTSDVEKTPTLYQKINDIELALEQYCPDYDNNGNIHVDVYYIDLTKTADMQYVSTNSAKFYGEVQRGEAELFICDTGILGDENADENTKEWYEGVKFSDMFLDLGKVTGNSSYDGMLTVKLKDTPLAKDARWENSCPDVLNLCVRREAEGMLSYSEKSLENNAHAQEVLRNILSGNKLHESKAESN